MKKTLPYLIIVVLLIITFNLWLAAKQDLSLNNNQLLPLLSQILGLWGIVLMSITLLLTARLKFIENFLGGLDKVYGLHHIIGGVAFILILNHPILLAVNSIPNMQISLMYLLPGLDISYNFGIFAFYTMIFSFIFIVIIKLPYHFWKITHKFLGVAFLFASIHVLLIPSDVSANLLLRSWISSFLIIGIAAGFYTILFSRFIASRYKYTIEKIERSLDIINIYLRPLTPRALSFSPGQFVYIKFANKNLGNETHPFSISSGSHSEHLRISAKMVGDYTVKLPTLNKDDKAIVDGPYGKFLFGTDKKNVIWIAGGIGVTPFLSFLSSEPIQMINKNIYFFYTYRNKEEGVFDEEIKSKVQELQNVFYWNWCTSEKSRLNAKIIGTQVSLEEVDAIYLCGPIPMMEGFRDQFIKMGIPEEKIYFENFSFLE